MVQQFWAYGMFNMRNGLFCFFQLEICLWMIKQLREYVKMICILLLGIRSRSEQIVPSGSCFRLRLYDPILYWKHKKPFSFVRLSKHQALQVVDLRCATKHLWPQCTQRQNMYTTIYTMHDFSSWVITDDISCVHIITIITSFTLWHVQGKFLKSTLWKVVCSFLWDTLSTANVTFPCVGLLDKGPLRRSFLVNSRDMERK